VPRTLTTRALGAGFAAALLLGAAACGDDEVDEDTEVDDEVDAGVEEED